MAIAVKIINAPNTCCILPVKRERKRVFVITFRPPYAITNSGIPTPITYATVTRIALKVTFPVAASVVIAANIGPAHGDHTMPSEAPVIKPVRNPLPSFELCPNKLVSLLINPSNFVDRDGITIVRPNMAIIAIAAKRNVSGSKLKIFTK